MLVEEASQLVINAGAIGRDGEVLVLDMGEPVKIADVAQRFADRHHPPLEIVYTGLRPGEKLHEDLVATDEQGERPFHPLITHVQAFGLAPAALRRGDLLHGTDLVEFLRSPILLAV
jgi:FlaA1/EpsC-like NDP-sugar epimerase